jgi:hypothetical protein
VSIIIHGNVHFEQREKNGGVKGSRLSIKHTSPTTVCQKLREQSIIRTMALNVSSLFKATDIFREREGQSARTSRPASVPALPQPPPTPPTAPTAPTCPTGPPPRQREKATLVYNMLFLCWPIKVGAGKLPNFPAGPHRRDRANPSKYERSLSHSFPAGRPSGPHKNIPPGMRRIQGTGARVRPRLLEPRESQQGPRRKTPIVRLFSGFTPTTSKGASCHTGWSRSAGARRKCEKLIEGRSDDDGVPENSVATLELRDRSSNQPQCTRNANSLFAGTLGSLGTWW